MKKGDINGDTEVNIFDAVALLNAIKGTRILDGEYKQAACVKNESEFSIFDAVCLLNYIKGDTEFELKSSIEENTTEEAKNGNVAKQEESSKTEE